MGKKLDYLHLKHFLNCEISEVPFSPTSLLGSRDLSSISSPSSNQKNATSEISSPFVQAPKTEWSKQKLKEIHRARHREETDCDQSLRYLKHLPLCENGTRRSREDDIPKLR